MNATVNFVVFTAVGQHKDINSQPPTVSPTYEIPSREPNQQSNVVYEDLLLREPADTPVIYVNTRSTHVH